MIVTILSRKESILVELMVEVTIVVEKVCNILLLRPNDIYKFITLLPKDYCLIPRQRCQKHVETISNVYDKMELLFLLKMIYIEFVFVVFIIASAQVVQVIKVDI